MIPIGFAAVGDLAAVDSGPAFKSREFKGPGEGIPLLRGDNIEPGSLRWARTKTWPVRLLGGHEHLHVADGDLILGMDRPLVSAGLKLARVTSSDLPALLVQRVARIRPIEIDSCYLYYLLSSPEFIRHLLRNSTGTQLPHVTLRSIREFRLPRFKESDERYIVDAIDEHFSHLDAATRTLKIAAARLDRLQERHVLDAITGGRSDRSHPAALADVGTHDGLLPALPNGWSWSRLGEIADVVGGVTKDSKRQSDPGYVELPYLRVANVQRGRLDLSDVSRIRVSPAKAEALRLRPGDVLLNEGGDRDKLGRGWVWEGQIDQCIHQNHVFRARIHDERIDPYFLSWTVNTIGARWAERNGKQSVNLASISLSMIRRMPVIVPAVGSAEIAIAGLRERLASVARLREEVVRARERSVALRRAVLAVAFSGDLSGSVGGGDAMLGELVGT